MITSYRPALAHLRRADPVLAAVIARVGPCGLQQRRAGTHYDALVRSIVYQQLSGKAAGTIHRRFCELYPAKRPRAELVMATGDDQLRAAGLSRQKMGYLRDLSTRVAEGTLPLAHLGRLPDDAIIEHLVQVRELGAGPLRCSSCSGSGGPTCFRSSTSAFRTPCSARTA